MDMTTAGAAGMLAERALAIGREVQRPQSASRRVRRGEARQDFRLTDQAGQPWQLSEALRDGAVVLVFYRGDW